MPQTRASTLPEVLALLRRHGRAPSRHAPITQRDHALQCASLAQASGASTAVVSACLLHDVGQLLDAEEQPCLQLAGDETLDRYEVIGAAWLADLMPPAVVQAVRWHAQAKRYLAASLPEWRLALDATARQDLERRGGPMSRSECAAFERRPHAAEALAVAGFDVRACVPGGVAMIPMEALAHPLEACARRA